MRLKINRTELNIFRNGSRKPLIEYRIRKENKENFSKHECERAAKWINSNLVRQNKKGKLQIATLKWQYVCGNWVSVGEAYIPDIYSISNYYDVPLQADEIQNEISLYFLEDDAEEVGSSKCNDCLYI